ncbi:MAG: hypothetical protein ACRDVW_04625 [Acidimicrobiales bacterium]
MLAILVTGEEFHGGVLTRVAGHSFLVAGTISVALTIPLALTASRRAQRWLGPHWKTLHRVVYVLWVTILIHLAFLFAFRTLFIAALEMSAPLFVMRLPVVKRWWASARRRHRQLALRWVGGIMIWSVFGLGLVTIVHEYINVGIGALLLHPGS